jgi:hypothetical protein
VLHYGAPLGAICINLFSLLPMNGIKKARVFAQGRLF